jgi:hypothetical protein
MAQPAPHTRFLTLSAAPAVCGAVEGLRRRRHTGAQIAAEVGVSAATVSRILKRLGLNRLSALEPAEPVRRYERAAPGEIIHIDIKSWQVQSDRPSDHGGSHKSGQHPWDRLGICASGDRRTFPSRLFGNPAGRKTSVLPTLSLQRLALLSKPRRQGRARHDRQRLKLPLPSLCQGAAPAQDQASAHQALHAQNQRQGRALVQTSLREWAYARAYSTSEERAAELPIWLHRYDWHRPHGSIGAKPPISRLSVPRDNVLRLHN